MENNNNINNDDKGKLLFLKRINLKKNHRKKMEFLLNSTKRIKNPFLKILKIILILLLLSKSKELTCDKVASLPKDFETLLPNYKNLPKVHIYNYFF